MEILVFKFRASKMNSKVQSQIIQTIKKLQKYKQKFQILRVHQIAKNLQ